MESDSIGRSISAFSESWRVALSMALYREPGAVNTLKQRICIGTMVMVSQVGFLYGADRIRAGYPGAFSDSYLCGSLVFWSALILSALVVWGILFVRTYLRIVSADVRGVGLERRLTEGLGILQDMQLAYRTRNEQLWGKALERGKYWHQVTMPAVFRDNRRLRAAFDASTYESGPYDSEWSGPAMWVPALDRETGRLREAIESVREQERREALT